MERAQALGPAIAERWQTAHEMRRIPDETIADLIDAGLFKACQPARVGGYQHPFGTQTSIGIELAKYCGSTGWIASVLGTHHWILGKFPLDAQTDVWGQNRDALVASAFASIEPSAERVAGGYRVSGTWLFASGVHSVDWCIILVRLAGTSADDPPEARFMLVPRADFEIKDVWRTTGMRGTGSNHLHVAGAFIPEHRSLSQPVINQLDTPGTADGAGPEYRLPFAGTVGYCVSAPTLGLAEGALDAFTAAMGARTGIIAGRLRDNAQLQVRSAEASAEIDCARLLYESDMQRVAMATRSGTGIPARDIARMERNAAYIGVLARRATSRLAEAMGAKGLDEGNPVQRANSDIAAACAHISMVWDANAQSYGRALLGAEPASRYDARSGPPAG
jgi:alkylation response protein AidB-like acyl-CoA dehydrogenase